MRSETRYLRIRRLCTLVGLSVLCATPAWLEVRASVDAELLARSRSVLGIPEHWLRGATRELAINGARVQLASGHSQQSLTALLDRAEADCRVNSAGLFARQQQVYSSLKRASSIRSAGVLRVENEKEGLVACLALGSHEVSWSELSTRLQRFSHQGDLAALGGVRMLRAQVRAQGAFFVTIATQGPAPLVEMFPSHADAPGREFETLPRPATARRVLSVWQQNGSPALNVYEAREYDRTLATFLRDAASRGFRHLAEPATTSRPSQSFLLGREGHQFAVTALATERGALIVLMALDSGPGAL